MSAPSIPQIAISVKAYRRSLNAKDESLCLIKITLILMSRHERRMGMELNIRFFSLKVECFFICR